MIDREAFRDARIYKPGVSLEDFKRRILLEALEYHRWNKSRTARALRVSLRWVRNKCHDYSLFKNET